MGLAPLINFASELGEILRKHVYLRSKDERLLLARLIEASYFVDAAETVPFLIALSPSESGKSRLMQAASSLCYHGALFSLVNAPHIFRLREECRISLCIDEADFRRKEVESSLEDVLNVSYAKGTRVVRYEKGRGFEKREFHPYGLVLIALRENIPGVLKSRAIAMRRVNRDFPLCAPRSYTEIRDKLYALRLGFIFHRLCTEIDLSGCLSARVAELYKIIFAATLIFGRKSEIRPLLRWAKEHEKSSRATGAHQVREENIARCLKDLVQRSGWFRVRDLVEIYAKATGRSISIERASSSRASASGKGIGTAMASSSSTPRPRKWRKR